jgi:hypothetical protein
VPPTGSLRCNVPPRLRRTLCAVRAALLVEAEAQLAADRREIASAVPIGIVKAREWKRAVRLWCARQVARLGERRMKVNNQLPPNYGFLISCALIDFCDTVAFRGSGRALSSGPSSTR